MGSKYNNKKTNGYDSKKEFLYSLELKQAVRDGYISDLKEQVVFELIPKQTEIIDGNTKILERPCTYVADFTYLDKKCNLVVVDVKGFVTDVYKIKKKLMLYIHKIKIKEV